MNEESKYNIIVTDNKTYDLTINENTIDFLIFALNGQYYSFFIDFVFAHSGINIQEYAKKFVEAKKSKSVFDVQYDTRPFFNYICEDYIEENVFYKYVYLSSDSDLIKKQKINKIIDGLKKTLDYYFDFHNASIFWNCEIEKNFEKIREYSIEIELCFSYIYYCICKILINFYDYLYEEFYTFIDSKNEFSIKYSNKIKDLIRKESTLTKKELTKIDLKPIWVNIFFTEKDFENFKYYLENKIVDDYADLSYLFQKLLSEKKINNKKHLDFNDWLFQNNLIKQNTFQKIQNNNGFRSLEKSYSKHRESNYFEIFK